MSAVNTALDPDRRMRSATAPTPPSEPRQGFRPLRPEPLRIVRGVLLQPADRRVHNVHYAVRPAPGAAAPMRATALPKTSTPLAMVSWAAGISSKLLTRPRQG